MVCIALALRFNKTQFANQYGVPGSPGALDARRWRRRCQTMVNGRPVTIAAGEQMKSNLLRPDGPPERRRQRTAPSMGGPVGHLSSKMLRNDRVLRGPHRRRVFIVGRSDSERAGAVLFKREGSPGLGPA